MDRLPAAGESETTWIGRPALDFVPSESLCPSRPVIGNDKPDESHSAGRERRRVWARDLPQFFGEGPHRFKHVTRIGTEPPLAFGHGFTLSPEANRPANSRGRAVLPSDNGRAGRGCRSRPLRARRQGPQGG